MHPTPGVYTYCTKETLRWRQEAGSEVEKRKFADYIQLDVETIFSTLHNIGTLRRVPYFHFGCIFIGLDFLCPHGFSW